MTNDLRTNQNPNFKKYASAHSYLRIPRFEFWLTVIAFRGARLKLDPRAASSRPIIINLTIKNVMKSSS